LKISDGLTAIILPLKSKQINFDIILYKTIGSGPPGIPARKAKNSPPLLHKIPENSRWSHNVL